MMEIGTGRDESVKVVVDGKVRLQIDPDGSFHWFCAHAHAPDGAEDCVVCSAEMDCGGVMHGHFEGELIGRAVLDALRMNLPIQATVGPRGTAEVLPNRPAGYIVVNVADGEFVIPFFRKS